MKKLLTITLAALLCALFCSTALAEQTIYDLNVSPGDEFHPATGTYFMLKIPPDARVIIDEDVEITLEAGNTAVYGALQIEGTLTGTLLTGSALLFSEDATLTLGQNGWIDVTFLGDGAEENANRFLDLLTSNNTLASSSITETENGFRVCCEGQKACTHENLLCLDCNENLTKQAMAALIREEDHGDKGGFSLQADKLTLIVGAACTVVFFAIGFVLGRKKAEAEDDEF